MLNNVWLVFKDLEEPFIHVVRSQAVSSLLHDTTDHVWELTLEDDLDGAHRITTRQLLIAATIEEALRMVVQLELHQEKRSAESADASSN